MALAAASLVASGEARAARIWYVSTSGNDGAPGTSGAPLRTIEQAVSNAASGDTIEVGGGVYNESVQVFNKAVHIRSVAGQRATLDGAVAISGFVASGGDWYSPNWTTEFAVNTGPMVGSRAEAAYPDQVFIDGAPLTQVLSRDAVVPGTFFHETGANRIWVGSDPSGRLLEASNRSWAIYLNRANGSSLTDITVRRYATDGSDLAAIRVQGRDHTLTGVVSEYNAYSGLSVIGSNITIRNGRFNDNGYIGLHGHQLNGVTVDDSSITRNNRELFNNKHSGSGLKVTNASNVVVRRNHVAANAGPGIWTDDSSSAITVVGNHVTDNARSGIQIELSTDATIAGNVSMNNGEAGIWMLESQNAAVWHNALVDNEHEISVLEGPRRDVQNISLRNNILGRSAPVRGSLPLLRVDDWTENRSAAQMTTSSNHNLYWRAQASVAPVVSRWARWPQPLEMSATIASAVGHDGNSTEREGGRLPIRSAANADYRPDSTVPAGEPLSAAVATALGLAPGASLPIGPTAATSGSGSTTPPPSPGSPPPVPSPGPENNPPTASGLRRAVRIGVTN